MNVKAKTAPGKVTQARKTLPKAIVTRVKEETDRTGSISKAGLHLGPDCGLWAMCPVSMEMTYKLENQTPLPPTMKEPQDLYLDSPSPKRVC